MALTKRGKRIRAIALLIGLILTAQFLATHHRESFNCKWNYEVAGYECDTKWIQN